MNTIDKLLEAHASLKSQLTVKSFCEKDEVTEEYALIEGHPDSLRFLAELILAFVASDSGCGFFIHPKGPGSTHFSKKSKMGIYFHKLPCDSHQAKKRTRKRQ